MMLPVYLIAVMVNIIAKNNNYNIKPPRNPDFDVRVRRGADLDKSIDFDGGTGVRYEGNNVSSLINALEYLMSQYEDIDVSQNPNFDKRVKRNRREGYALDGDKSIDFNGITAPLKQEENKNSLEATFQNKQTGENSDFSDITYKNVIDSIAGYTDSEKRKELSETIASILQGLAEVYTKGYNNAQKAYNLNNQVGVTKRELNSKNIEGKDQQSDSDEQYTDTEKTAGVLKELATTINEFTEALTKYLNENSPKKLHLEAERTKREVNSVKNTDKNTNDVTEIKDDDRRKVDGEEESAEGKEKLKVLKPLTRSVRFVHDIGLYGAKLIGSDFSYAEFFDTIENNDKNPPKKNPTKVLYADDTVKNQLREKKPNVEVSKEKSLNKNNLVGLSLTDKSVQTSSKPKVVDDLSKENVGEKLLEAEEVEYTTRKVLKSDGTTPIENLEHSGKDVIRFDDRKPSVDSSNDSIVKYITTNKNNFKPNMNVTGANNKSQTPLEVDKTFKILELFDEIEDILDVYIQESNLEEETILDDIGVVSRTESKEHYELAVDETDIENHDHKKRKTRKQKKTQNNRRNNKRKKLTNNDAKKINDERKSKLVKRNALPENVVSNFFYNIYSKVYNLTHSKKDVEDNTIPSTDTNYNFYNNQYSYNQNYGYNDNQYENNRMTHSAYTKNNYGAYVNPADINTNGDNNNNYGYNLPATNGYSNNPTYNYNYAHGYAYNQPMTNGFSPYNSYPYNQYGYNNNNVPTNGYDGHENYINTTPDYKFNYGNNFNYETSTNVYGYNTPPKNGYSYNSTLNNGYGYNATVVNDLNVNTTTEKTIMEGCVFCTRIRCQKGYRWVGVACAPIGKRG